MTADENLVHPAAPVVPLVDEGLGNSSYLGGAVLDVRQESEFEAGHLPGAQHIELGSLPDRLDTVRREPLVVMCGHGERAMTAASLLHRELAVLTGGAPDWAAATGQDMETG